MWPGTAAAYGEFLAASDGSEFADAAGPLVSPRAGATS